RAKLFSHTRRGRDLPQTSTKTSVKASDGKAAQQFTWDVCNKGLHTRGLSHSLCWASQDEYIHTLEFFGVYLTNTSCSCWSSTLRRTPGCGYTHPGMPNTGNETNPEYAVLYCTHPT